MSSDQLEMIEIIDSFRAELQQLRASRERLLAVNTELLAALKGYHNYDETLEARQNRAMAAIARAEGMTSPIARGQ